MSREKAPVVDEMQEKTGQLAPAPEDFIKDPYVLDFLGLQDKPGFRECPVYYGRDAATGAAVEAEQDRYPADEAAYR